MPHAEAEVPACEQPSPRCANNVTVAVDADGSIWRAFVNGQFLYLQERLNGGGFAAPMRVNAMPQTILNRGENRIQLAFGAEGQVYVAWSVPLAGKWTCGMRFSRSLDGRHFSPPLVINHNRQPMTHCFPTMRVGANGTIVVVWLDRRDHAAASKAGDSYRGMALYGNWSTDGGNSFQPKDQLMAAQTCQCCRIALTFWQGSAQVFFRKIYPDNIRDHAWVSLERLDEPGKALRVSHDNWQLSGCPEQGPALAATSERLHFLWFDKGELHYRYWQDGHFGPVSQVGKKGAEHPDMLVAEGRLYRAWRRYADGAMRVLLQVSSDQGGHWCRVRELASTNGGSDYPQLLAADGRVWLAWLTDQQGFRLLPVSAAQRGDK